MKVAESIPTSRGPFPFNSIELFHGRGRINPQHAEDNLFLASDVLTKSQIKHGLIYGTLLGAIRDGNFIPWDEDVDIFMVDEDRERLHDTMWALKDVGFDLVRNEGDLYSIMRNNDYIDIYVFRKQRGGKRWCNADVLDESFFTFEDSVNFLGRSFHCPTQPTKFLHHMYGEDWRTPKENYPARPWSTWRKFKRALRDAFPPLANLYFKITR